MSSGERSVSSLEVFISFMIGWRGVTPAVKLVLSCQQWFMDGDEADLWKVGRRPPCPTETEEAEETEDDEPSLSMFLVVPIR